jgi:AcrR family transcriptional regulator
MERRTRAKPEVRRDQILGEAVHLVGERGYYGFTIKELAQRCGLGNAGLLHHFGSKEQLLVALLEERDRRDTAAATDFMQDLKKGADGGDLSVAEFREVVRSAVVRSSRQPEFIRLFTILQAEALNDEHPAYDYFLRRENLLLQAFTVALAPHVAEPLFIARQLIAQWLGLEQLWLRANQGFDLVAEWDRVAIKLLPNPPNASPESHRSA